MPTSVNELFSIILHREPSNPIQWGGEIPCNSEGIYVISTLMPITSNDISDDKIKNWIDRVPAMRIDGLLPTPDLIKSRLSTFIYPDETILYIGQTTDRTIRARIKEFHNHILGNPSPHRGGHWLKTLNDMSLLNIYWAAVDNPGVIESTMLSHFRANVSEESRNNLYDPLCAIPFANLQYRPRKVHNISKQCL